MFVVSNKQTSSGPAGWWHLHFEVVAQIGPDLV
jgi:hypothetical protein